MFAIGALNYYGLLEFSPRNVWWAWPLPAALEIVLVVTGIGIVMADRGYDGVYITAEPVNSLTGLQLQHLLDFWGGELDCEICFGRFPERQVPAGEEPMPAGVYAWFTPHAADWILLPEESNGALSLSGDAADVKPQPKAL